jgi:hypothetical protein
LAAVEEQIQTVVAALSSDELSAVASELGLSPQEVEAMMQDAEFASLVAEELAQPEPVDA